MKNPALDRDKIKVAVRRLPQVSLLDVLDRAIDQVPASRLSAVIHGHLRAQDLVRPSRGAKTLLAEIESFRKDSLAGRYYEDFLVNSKNCTQKSRGTQAWIAECDRLFRRVTAATGKFPAKTVCRAFEALFDILRLMESNTEVVFWADEGGVYEIGLDWPAVLGAYFRCMAGSTTPDVYPLAVGRVINDFVRYDSDRFLKLARTALENAARLRPSE